MPVGNSNDEQKKLTIHRWIFNASIVALFWIKKE